MKVLTLSLVLMTCAVCSEGTILLLLKKKLIKNAGDIINFATATKVTHADIPVPSLPFASHLPSLSLPESIPVPVLRPVFHQVPLPTLDIGSLNIDAHLDKLSPIPEKVASVAGALFQKLPKLPVDPVGYDH